MPYTSKKTIQILSKNCVNLVLATFNFFSSSFFEENENKNLKKKTFFDSKFLNKIFSVGSQKMDKMKN